MTAVNVSAEIEIAAEPTDVAGVMFDPQREPEWMSAVKTVALIDAGIKPGARVRHAGTFVGQEVAWTTAVESFHFPHALTLKVVDGPFTGTVSYSVQRSGAGSVARITNRGESSALGFLPASMIEGGMRKMLEGDLARLKGLIENGR
ncbi:MAG TPA: SRPBCC family protein [Vicinamibacterales bacterium]|nr:SRPBCC family protein [Vicinamibacterales bacterium]